jgi:hydrogenase expression/formation protein HypE
MNDKLPEIGKISPEIFNRIIYPKLGRESDKVLAGPRHGVDCGVVDLGNNQVMAITADPFFIVPQYGWEKAAWFAFHILASDISTSGLKPTYMSIDLNLPLSINEKELELMWTTVDAECKKYGVNIVTGHTAKYEGCNYPMVGGVTMIAIGPKDKYVTTQMAKPGDKVILTKGAAIEASALFAVTFPKFISDKLGSDFSKKSQELFWQMSTIDDALTAVNVGVHDNGVSTMHDATECGVWGGLYEIAKASNVGMRINKDDIFIGEETKKICSLFNIDPYSSISEGSLLITCREHASDKIIEELKAKNISAFVIGDVTEKEKGMKVIENGKEHDLEHPRIDPFWAAFGKAMKELKG